MNIFRRVLVMVIIAFSVNVVSVSGVESGKLILIKGGHQFKIQTRLCNSGVFLKKSVIYDCACINGVWAFYSAFCEQPFEIIGGRNFCFEWKNNHMLKQAAIIGSYSNPFAASISHFIDVNFAQLTHYVTAQEPSPDTFLDAMGAWITISNTNWTLFNDKNDSICLQPTMPVGKMKTIFCRFDNHVRKAMSERKWNMVTKVKSGCYSDVVVKADGCYRLKRPNGEEGCNVIPNLTPCPDLSPTELNETSRVELGKTVDPDCFGDGDNDQQGSPWFKDADGNVYFRKPKTSPRPTPKPKDIAFNKTILQPKSAGLLLPPEKVQCDKAISRQSVKAHWLHPGNNECARSINEAMFTDQLRRFAVTRFNKAFESRVQSLDQMNQLLDMSRDVLKKTCGSDYVPQEFLDVASQAFFMFVQEDFFYGAQGIDTDTFDRIMKSLKKCWKRAKVFVFESETMSCDLKKLNRTLILPGKTANLTIPAHGKSNNFEPLIETAWKIFLNAHSYCYEDFLVNDHHLFSIQFMELFSRTIYEKWIDPLHNRELYKFILPHYSLMKEIMENIETCVAAAEYISHCPVWLQRSNPASKRNLDKVHGRKKRSTWAAEREQARKEASIWKDKAYCLQRMDDVASSLHLASCKMIY